MKVEKTSINCNGRKVNILLQIPNKKNPSVIIMVHGYGGEGLEEYFINTGKELAKNGFYVVNFQFTGFNDVNNISSFSIKDSIEELKYVINFVEKQEINKDDINILAQSLGCSISILLNDFRIKKNIFLAPVIDLKKVFSTLFKEFGILEELEEKGIATYTSISRGTDKRIGAKFWDEVKEINRVSVNQIKIPTLLIYGTKDKLVDSSSVKRFYEQLNVPKKIFAVNNAPHVTIRNLKQREEVIKQILEFVFKG